MSNPTIKPPGPPALPAAPRPGSSPTDAPSRPADRTGLRRIVVVPKPLSLPSPTATAPDNPEALAIAHRLAVAHREHAQTIARVGEVLGGSNDEVSWVASPSPRDLADADLIITIGGDGTFLTVARHVVDTPLFGVNSSPTTSTGHYCAATADSFEPRLADVLSGHVAPSMLTRIALALDGHPVGPLALNDVLFAHQTPVSSTRYALRLGDRSELQLSSGIWIATATGSTGALRSAGGEVMALTDPRLQFRVREPYLHGTTGTSLLGGFCESLEIVSRNDKNALFLDGHPEAIPLRFGARALLRRADAPLRAFLAYRWQPDV